MAQKMKGAYLPGDRTVVIKEYDVPKPGFGQVLVRVKATTLCGSDKMLYRGLVDFPRRKDLIAGHEVSGIIEEEGEGLKLFQKGDRVIIYHCSGCGVCCSCRKGYVNLCRSKKQKTYGWQCDGGLAEYMVADEKDLIRLPDEMSYLDGAPLTCSFGSVYEAMQKAGISGDNSVLVEGLGPVGLSCLLLAKALGAKPVIGVNRSEYRRKLALRLGLADAVFSPEEAENGVYKLMKGNGVERSFDASGSEEGRQQALRLTCEFGKTIFLGEGSELRISPTFDLIHTQKSILGSWASPLWRVEDLFERLVRWNVHPEKLVTHTFHIDEADEMFKLMDSDECGKVAVLFED